MVEKVKMSIKINSLPLPYFFTIMPMKNPIITQDTLSFLKEIAENNHREWFAEQKKRYDAIAKENKLFFQQIFEALQKHDEVTRMHIFRIYKDVRFSKDKSPYKTNFGVAFSRKKPELRGGYYIHIAPNQSFVGGGFWAPEKEDMYRFRKELEMDDTPIRSIITEPTFQEYFKTIQGDDAVKIAPKGFDKNHPAMDLIKKKQWVVMRPFTDEQVMNESFLTETIKTFLAMRPWFDYMSDVLTTDLNGESIIG